MSAHEDDALLREFLAAIDASEPVALATVVETRESVPRHAGSKMLVRADGRCSGSVGGGEMEARVIAEARRWPTGAVASRCAMNCSTREMAIPAYAAARWPST